VLIAMSKSPTQLLLHRWWINISSISSDELISLAMLSAAKILVEFTKRFLRTYGNPIFLNLSINFPVTMAMKKWQANIVLGEVRPTKTGKLSKKVMLIILPILH